MPDLENAFVNLQARLSDLFGFAATVEHFLPVAFEMGPAHLTPQDRHLIVSSPAIAAHDAAQGRAEQFSQGNGIAKRVDEESDNLRRGRHPQPAFLTRLFPAGLINVLDWRFLHGLQSFLMS